MKQKKQDYLIHGYDKIGREVAGCNFAMYLGIPIMIFGLLLTIATLFGITFIIIGGFLSVLGYIGLRKVKKKIN